MEENREEKREKPIDLYVYSLREGQIASYVAVGKGDLMILWMYKGLFKKPMRAVFHDMVGTAAKCWEEHHVRKIKEMEEKIATYELIIMRYIQKFGRIRPH